MAPNSPGCSFIQASMARSRSTAPLNRSKSVLIVAPLLAFEIHANVAPLSGRKERNRSLEALFSSARGPVRCGVHDEAREISIDIDFPACANSYRSSIGVQVVEQTSPGLARYSRPFDSQSHR